MCIGCLRGSPYAFRLLYVISPFKSYAETPQWKGTRADMSSHVRAASCPGSLRLPEAIKHSA